MNVLFMDFISESYSRFVNICRKFKRGIVRSILERGFPVEISTTFISGFNTKLKPNTLSVCGICVFRALPAHYTFIPGTYLKVCIKLPQKSFKCMFCFLR